jgi:hypothetical protein
VNEVHDVQAMKIQVDGDDYESMAREDGGWGARKQDDDADGDEHVHQSHQFSIS